MAQGLSSMKFLSCVSKNQAPNAAMAPTANGITAGAIAVIAVVDILIRSLFADRDLG